jgi:hypothetical protein
MKTWKKHPNYSLLVSKDGRVAKMSGWINTRGDKYYRKAKIIPQTLIRGYPRLSWCENGKRITQRVHRLVAETFLGLNAAMQVNHIDHNKLNNNVENLEWCTSKENAQARDKFHGEKYTENRINGNRHKFKPVICSDGTEYESIMDATRKSGVKRANIQHSLRTKYRAGGLYWFFLDKKKE